MGKHHCVNGADFAAPQKRCDNAGAHVKCRVVGKTAPVNEHGVSFGKFEQRGVSLAHVQHGDAQVCVVKTTVQPVSGICPDGKENQDKTGCCVGENVSNAPTGDFETASTRQTAGDSISWARVNPHPAMVCENGNIKALARPTGTTPKPIQGTITRLVTTPITDA
jgi:hypothetical protein